MAMLAGVLTAYAEAPSRESYNLNSGWRFYFADAPDAADADYVTLPHTWNVDDGEGSYLRTTANYIRELNIPKEWEGKRLFMRFGGAQSVAELFVNGNYVGEHRGGFTAFTIEITDHVRYGTDNHLRVVVSNDMRSDVLPLSTDVNLAGGIYRDVELMVTPKDIISPLYYGTGGVIVEQHKVTKENASGVVKVYLSTKSIDHTTVTMRMVGEDGYEVLNRTVKASKISAERAVEIPFEVVNPALWSPQNRAMYVIEITLGDEKQPYDRVVVRTGLRSIEVNDDNKLCINGMPVDVRGVNMPHDRAGVGTALERKHYEEDFATLTDMGANAVRSLVGPHDDYLYEMCDREGVLAWIDMPLTRSDLFEGFNNQDVNGQLRGITNGLCDGFYAINNSLKDGFYATQANIKDCCCTTNRNIDAVRAENYKNTCEITSAIHAEGEATRALINANTMQALRDKLADKDRDVLIRDFQLSQQAQNAALIAELRPCAKPAYITCSPYTTQSFCGCGV